MTDTRTTLCGITLDNPIIPASGTFGYGHEYAKLYDINLLGSFSFKGTTAEARFGNPTPRIAECPAGLINSVGLQNPGVKAVIERELPRLSRYYRKKVMANVSGFSPEEFCEVVSALDECEYSDMIGWYEVNISCPNVHGGGDNFGSSCTSASTVVREVRKTTKKPIIIKLSPNVTAIAEIARACEDSGADGISLINTLYGMRISLKTKKPVVANKLGGYSGPGTFPVALGMVYRVYEAVKIPIVGVGGVSSAEEAVEMMLAGATAVEVGAANLRNPYASKEIVETLPEVMEKYGIERLSDIIGAAH